MKNTIISLVFLILIGFSSCKDVEKKTMSDGEAQTLLTEAVIAYSIFSGTQEDATRAGLETESVLNKSARIFASGDYPQITVDPMDLSTWPKTITIDYGPENITGIDGHERRGTMIMEADNFPDVDGANWEITFSDYYHDDHKVDGEQTIKYIGENADGHPEYQCTVTDGMITTPEDKIYYFEQQITREWIEGYDTNYILTGELADLCDDTFKITGSHWGISSDGYSYSMSADKPLIVNICCRWVKDGVLKVSMDDYELSCEIDYNPAGDSGECNNQAAFSIFGVSVPIELP